MSVQAAFDHAVAEFTATAVSTLYFYDVLLTWDDEISLFWNIRGSWLINVLFLINRYLPFVGLSCIMMEYHPLIRSDTGSGAIFLSHMPLIRLRCRFIMLGSLTCQEISVIVTMAIFSLRAHTIFKSIPWVQYLILAAFWTSSSAVVITEAIIMTRMKPTIVFASGACTTHVKTTQQSAIIGGLYLAPLLCETVVLVATARHALDMKRNHATLRFSAMSPVLHRLYQDGFAYFVVVFSLRLFSCSMWLFSRPSLKYFSDFFEYSIRNIVTSRFFLSLRRSLVESSLGNYSPDWVETFDGMGGTIRFGSAVQRSNSYYLDSIDSPTLSHHEISSSTTNDTEAHS